MVAGYHGGTARVEPEPGADRRSQGAPGGSSGAIQCAANESAGRNRTHGGGVSGKRKDGVEFEFASGGAAKAARVSGSAGKSRGGGAIGFAERGGGIWRGRVGAAGWAGQVSAGGGGVGRCSAKTAGFAEGEF